MASNLSMALTRMEWPAVEHRTLDYKLDAPTIKSKTIQQVTTL